MLTLPTNSANFIGRFFFLALTLFLGYLFINFGLNEPKNAHVIFRISNFDFKVIYIMYFIIAAVCGLTLTIIFSLLSFKKIQIDTASGIITFIGLFNKRTIQTSDINEYFNTVHINSVKKWNGLLLQLKDDKTIQVAGQNIKFISDLKNYLDDNKIICAGQKKMKFPFN